MIIYNMTFKELYCYDCNESLGHYNETYFSDRALRNVIKYNQKSPLHEKHDIIMRDS